MRLADSLRATHHAMVWCVAALGWLATDCHGCAAIDGHAFADAPGIFVSWDEGRTAEQPWHDLRLAVIAIDETLALDHPTHPELRSFSLSVWGSNDVMWCPSTPPVVAGGTILGCTELNECGALGLDCGPVVRVRQIRQFATAANPDVPGVVSWAGPLLDVDVSALWDEVQCRLVPMRLGLPDGYGPECDAARAAVRARYYALVTAAHDGGVQ